MKGLMQVFLATSIIAAIVAVFSVSDMTMGPVAVAFACFWAILARMCQASVHHREIMGRMGQQSESRPKGLREMLG